jgi:hypothetical protein
VGRLEGPLFCTSIAAFGKGQQISLTLPGTKFQEKPYSGAFVTFIYTQRNCRVTLIGMKTFLRSKVQMYLRQSRMISWVEQRGGGGEVI